MQNNDLFVDYSFIKKLSHTELMALFNEYYNATGEKKKKIEDYIIENNIYLVLEVVNNSFKDTKELMEDYVSIGSEGLIKAVKSYDRKLSNNFPHYARRIIYKDIIRIINRRKNVEIVSCDTTYLDFEDDFIERIEDKDTYQILLGIINDLNPEDKEIANMFFVEGISALSISSIYLVSKEYIYRKLEKIKKMILNRLKYHNNPTYSGKLSDELNIAINNPVSMEVLCLLDSDSRLIINNWFQNKSISDIAKEMAISPIKVYVTIDNFNKKIEIFNKLNLSYDKLMGYFPEYAGMLTKEEFLWVVSNALNSLAKDKKEIARLYYLENNNIGDIVINNNMNLKTVMNTIAYINKNIKELVENYINDGTLVKTRHK